MLTTKAISRKSLLLFASILFILSMTSCSSVSGHQINVKKNIPVAVMRVQKGSIQNMTTYTGLIKPKQVAYVVSAIPGKVTAAQFSVGDRVHRGDLLFTVDSSEIEDGIKALEEQLKVAEANVSMAETGVVAASGSQFESQRLQLEASLKSAESSFVAAKSAFDDATYLLEAGMINRIQYNQVKHQYDMARNALDSPTKGYDLYMG
ncbi:MAG: efflux RND transporter periplasmic adaptor subunit, partial [Clostridia bacterium]|nr:efflux RND transporter periplasmic adaptor subunit [Clostridia bacterium]